MSSLLTTFCCLVTLQVGVAVLSASFFTMSAAILATNVFSYGLKTGSTWPVNLILVIIFVIWLVTAASLTIASAHTESRLLAITSSVAIAVLTCYWIILCGFSFAGDSEAVDAVCIDERCPESLWIANLKYRNSTSTRRVNRTSARNVTTTLSEDNDISDHLYRDDPLRDYSYYYINTTAVNQDKKLLSHNYTYHLFGAIILFIINVSFFIYSVFVMWRWASELDWTDPVETEPELAPTPRPALEPGPILKPGPAPKLGPILNPGPAPRPRPAPYKPAPAVAV